jgi:multidrug efflux system membrane fusion protein
VDGDRTAITAGLEAGEQVVVSGVDRLRNGAKVVLPGPRGKEDGKARSTALGARAGVRQENAG